MRLTFFKSAIRNLQSAIVEALFVLSVVGTALSPSTAGAQVVRTQKQFPGAAQNQPPIPSHLTIHVEGDQVTAEIRATPMQDALEELAARTGVIFEVDMQTNPPVSVTLLRVSLQEAIQRIVSGSNAIFYYERDETKQSRIRLVRVFPRGIKGNQPSLRYIGTGVATKVKNEASETPDQALKALSEGRDVDTRQKAVEILAAAKGEIAVRALMKALSDPAAEVKVAAIEGLASLGTRAALPRILQALKDDHPGVRQSAVEAVALIGDAGNVKDLRPMERDSDKAVAVAAEMAIRKLSERRGKIDH